MPNDIFEQDSVTIALFFSSDLDGVYISTSGPTMLVPRFHTIEGNPAIQEFLRKHQKQPG